MSKPHLFCFGLGYTGLRLARHLMDAGWQVSGTCREETGLVALKAQGISAVPFSGGQQNLGDVKSLLGSATHVLSTVPPGSEGDPVWNAFGGVLGEMSELVWIGYLSTTGVYGNTGGNLVDETAPTSPSGERGERRVRAEQKWLSLVQDRDLPIHIFRLPGIYGPGRSTLDQVKAGAVRRIDKPGHLFNRIHVDDIVQTLAASMANPNTGAIYNVCDDEPAAPGDVTAFACELLDQTPPPAIPFDEARENMSPMALSFWADNRRVSNARIKKELGIQLQYPTYREGLAAIRDQDSGS